MQTPSPNDLTALARSAVGFSRVITFEWGFSGAKPQNEAKKHLSMTMQTPSPNDLTAQVRSVVGFSRVIALERGFSGGSAPKRDIHIYRKVNADPSA